jgi:hypothetical protein
MSEATVTTFLVTVLLPVLVRPPFVSLVPPVVSDAIVVPGAVGTPETGHEIDAPGASEDTGNAGEHVPTVTPGGRPVMAHDTFVAAAVAVPVFVHSAVPEYGTPTVAVAGRLVRSGVTSEPVMATVVAAVWPTGSLIEVVEPVTG